MEKDTNQIYEKVGDVGEIRIADDVVAVVAGIATMEVDGVAYMAGNITKDIIAKLGISNLSKGVKVDVCVDYVRVYLNIVIKYGYSIPTVAKKVQEKVKAAIENMTGLKVEGVHIKFAGVSVANSDR